ncbi:MAG: hypothetical protein QHC40_02160 [Sphingobium sp.]|nr:hypothetical protein [Sphingobium sp.]
MENSHLPFRRRERAMLRFRQMKALQKFASVHATYTTTSAGTPSHRPTDLQAKTPRRLGGVAVDRELAPTLLA